MVAGIPIYFASRELLVAALGIVSIIFAVGGVRRVGISARSRLPIVIGMLLIAIAAGGPVWLKRSTPKIAVMVDLSASTRGAAWRDRVKLLRRVHELIGDLPFDLIGFGETSGALSENDPLPDLPGGKTVFAPPPADAVILFSDGQFELPAFALPTFAVVDPSLDEVGDGRVKELEVSGDRVSASVSNRGQPRELTWAGAEGDGNNAAVGSAIRSAKVLGDEVVTVRLSAGDRWPENDSMTVIPPATTQWEKWWVGERSPVGWTTMKPGELPDESMSYLNAGVIVLDNISVDSVSSSQQEHLAQFCRDLGGSIVLLGGEKAFGAGGYDGTVLDQLSPLASSPPGAAERWILLADASGSMAANAGTRTRWQAETSALVELLAHLPAEDVVNIGSFAGDVRWWSAGKSARDTAGLSLPPSGVEPNGPTALAEVLSDVVGKIDDSMPTQIIILTDAEAELGNQKGLALEMVKKRAHFNLLALGTGSALPELEAIAKTTGGSVLTELDPSQWVHSSRALLRTALPDRMSHESLQVTFGGDLAALPPQRVQQWNRTWLKTGATELATADERSMAARWQFGDGQVAAVSFSADVDLAETIAERIAAKPRDPRFTISHSVDSMVRIAVDAVDRGHFLNGREIQLQISNGVTLPMEQSAPGRYEATLPRTSATLVGTIRENHQVLGRFAIAGCYPVEFDAIGNNRAKLKELADRTGGRVIEVEDQAKIDFPQPTREISLASWFAGCGAFLMAMGLFALVRE